MRTRSPFFPLMGNKVSGHVFPEHAVNTFQLRCPAALKGPGLTSFTPVNAQPRQPLVARLRLPWLRTMLERRARLLCYPLVIVVMASGLSGCFDSKNDETFEDTVVLDDVDVRVVNAVADSPRLTLDVDEEARVEGIGFGEVGSFTLPANQYRFRARGQTGGDALEVVLDGAQDNLEEGRRFDLIVAGRLSNNSERIVLLSQGEEPFDPDTEEEDGAGDDEETDDVRLRIVHLVEGNGAIDLYLDSDPEAALEGDPDATLGFSQASDAVRIEEGVYRVRLTAAGNADSVLYDSGARIELERGDDALMAAAPNTGVDNSDHPVKLLLLRGQQASAFPDRDQRGGVRFVHAAAGAGDVDAQVDGVVWQGVPFAGIRPGSGLLDYALVTEGDFDLSVSDTAANDVRENLQIPRGQGVTAVLVNDAASDDVFSAVVMENDDRSVATNARVRLLHALSGNQAPVDVFLVPEGASLSEDGTVDSPRVSGLDYLKRSVHLAVAENEYDLVVTPEGAASPADELLREPLSLVNGENRRLILAGGGGSAPGFRVIRIGGVR